MYSMVKTQRRKAEHKTATKARLLKAPIRTVYRDRNNALCHTRCDTELRFRTVSLHTEKGAEALSASYSVYIYDCNPCHEHVPVPENTLARIGTKEEARRPTPTRAALREEEEDERG
jgi:hypothetical protein